MDLYIPRRGHARSTVALVMAKTNGRCWYCGVPVVPHPVGGEGYHYNYRKTLLHIDHFVPKNLGGSDEIENLVPACADCNILKGNRALPDFRLLVWFRQQGIKPIRPEHLNWLEGRGVSFRDEVETVRFWFEQEGLEP
jgi:5-methylcytosine-specific restriction endonuclease McrA